MKQTSDVQRTVGQQSAKPFLVEEVVMEGVLGKVYVSYILELLGSTRMVQN